MLRWAAAIAFCGAVLVRLKRPGPLAIGVRMSATVHRAYPVDTILFWALLVCGVTLLALSLFRRA